MHEPVPDASDARPPSTANVDLRLLINMETMDAKIRPMEQSSAGLQNVHNRPGSSDHLRVAVRKYWPQLLIFVFGLGLASALFFLQRAPVGGRSIVKITGVDHRCGSSLLLRDRSFFIV
jgi:hypothetical protein